MKSPNGWSAVISEDFTFERVRERAREIAKELPPQSAVAVGYDARFLADRFAQEIVKLLSAAGCACLLAERDLPAPVLAWSVKDRGLAGGVMVTGGGEAADRCGLKFFPGRQKGRQAPGLERFNPRDRYLKTLEVALDYDAISKARPKLVIDPLYGSARGYLDRLLQRLGCAVEEIHAERDVLFGGLAPAPREENLADLRNKIKESRADLGLAFDGAGEDFAVLDRKGNYYPSGHFTALGAADALWAGARVVEAAARRGLPAAF
ncbi:MAG: hypothetical protein JW873_05940 [Candidatus Saganbacteria bacterium]|nr:hypothetical protein [Candidatus Saganbacteria bacterium]